MPPVPVRLCGALVVLLLASVVCPSTTAARLAASSTSATQQMLVFDNVHAMCYRVTFVSTPTTFAVADEACAFLGAESQLIATEAYCAGQASVNEYQTLSAINPLITGLKTATWTGFNLTPNAAEIDYYCSSLPVIGNANKATLDKYAPKKHVRPLAVTLLQDPTIHDIVAHFTLPNECTPLPYLCQTLVCSKYDDSGALVDPRCSVTDKCKG